MGLPGNGSIRHGSCYKALKNGFKRFDFINVNRILFKTKKSPQKGGFLILLIDQAGEYLKPVIVIRFYCPLQMCDSFRIPCMMLTIDAIMIIACGLNVKILTGFTKCFSMWYQCFQGQILHPYPSYPADGSLEVFFNHIITESHRLKYLCRPVRTECGNPHFGKDLQQSFINCLDVIFFRSLIINLDYFVLYQFLNNGKSHIWINHRGTIAEKQGKMMNFPCFSGFKDDINLHPFALVDQVMMHGRNSQQGRDGNQFRGDPTV